MIDFWNQIATPHNMTTNMKKAKAINICAAVVFGALSIAALFAFPRFSVYRGNLLPTAIVATVAALLAFHPRFAAVPTAIGRIVMRPSDRAFGWGVFLAGTAWFAILSLVLFSGTPVLDDDSAALFQAKIFLSGRLRVPAPSPPEFFDQFGIISRHHGVPWLCYMYPFGHALVLLPGLALGVPWLVMPLFSGGACALTASLGRILFGERVARLAALCCLASPMSAELGATFLNHAPTAFGVLLATRGVLLCLRENGDDADGPDRTLRRRLLPGLETGIGLSLAMLCRPADAAVCGVILGLVAISRPVRAWRARSPFLVALAVLAVAIAAHLAWTQIQTGDWRVPGHTFFMGAGKYGLSDSFTLQKAIRNAAWRTMEFGAKSTGWPVAAFFPALLPLLRRRWRARALWLWSFPAALSAVYFFFFWYEVCFPARYLSAALAPLILLAAAGWATAAEAAGLSLSRTCLVPAALGLFVFLPAHLRSFDDHWHEVERILPRVVERAGLHNAVVIQSDVGMAHDRANRLRRYFASAFILNDPDFRGDVVFVHNLRSRNKELLGLFPGRTVWLYRYRRDRNLAELYRETFVPSTGEAVHDFVELPGLSGYVDPARDALTIPDAGRAPAPATLRLPSSPNFLPTNRQP